MIPTLAFGGSLALIGWATRRAFRVIDAAAEHASRESS